MARVYGRVQIQGTQTVFQGEILFEPKQLCYEVKGVLYAHFAYRQKLDDKGRFDLDVFPGAYLVHLGDACLETVVPAVSQVTLRELLTEGNS